MVTPRHIEAERASSGSPLAETADAERQLSALFGESLFGPWPELGPELANRDRSGGRKVWLWRLALVAALVGLFLGVQKLLEPGLDRKVAEDRSNYAQQLAMFLEDGALEQAAEFAALARGPSRAIEPQDPHLETLIRAEAALYRYFDADPKRLERLRPWLEKGNAGTLGKSGQLASITLLSRAERAEYVSELEALRAELAGDPELHYLLATAYEELGDVDKARQAWARSEDLGPAWLAHRFEQALFEAGQGKGDAAWELARDMSESSPSSAWSKAARSLFPKPASDNGLGSEATTAEPGRAEGKAAEPGRAEGKAAEPGRAEGKAAEPGAKELKAPPSGDTVLPEPAVPPVEIFREKLAQAVAMEKGGETSLAQERLVDAIEAVHGGQAFVLDAFDYLLRAKARVLCDTLTRLPQWPADSRIAQARVAQRAKLGKLP